MTGTGSGNDVRAWSAFVPVAGGRVYARNPCTYAAVHMNENEEQRLAEEYAARRAAAKAEVVRWVEADRNSTLHRPEPLLAEREREGAVVFAPRSRRARTYWRYGLDVHGRVVLAIFETPTGITDEQLLTFDEEGGVELVRYSRPDTPEELGHGRYAPDGSLLTWDASSPLWSNHEDYIRDEAGVLREIRATYEYAGPPTFRSDTRVLPEYGPGGRLQALIEERGGASPRRVPLPANSDKELRVLEETLRRLESRLAARVEASCGRTAPAASASRCCTRRA